MISKKAIVEARRIVDEAQRKGSDLHLTEYQIPERYRADHPNGRPMGDHNAIVRAAMREATRRGIYCVRTVVR